ncbi:hypothetical protein [Streptomyces sp. WZ-12]|uniref:hypothetical protein n=1 Tax=Streptomyces sp. WZ-12 TaxID=3030210 RepID=UPI0023812A42|nr:hypothetical protein [Streptomyces sp. WZ-12]
MHFAPLFLWTPDAAVLAEPWVVFAVEAEDCEAFAAAVLDEVEDEGEEEEGADEALLLPLVPWQAVRPNAAMAITVAAAALRAWWSVVR